MSVYHPAIHGIFPGQPARTRMQSLECMTSFVKRTTGDVPPPLVGPTTTFVPPHHVYLFGGRTVASRNVTSGLYVLDLETLEWRRLRPDAGKEGTSWPRERYFHSMDYWEGKLVVFGGMGAEGVPGSAGSDGTTTSVHACVLDDLWMFDLETGEWEECVSGSAEVVPVARYAHLSAVVGDRLVIIGGQEISNEYIFQQVVFHLPTQRWESARALPTGEVRGSYRSVAVAAEWELVIPAGADSEGSAVEDVVNNRLPYSRPRHATTPTPSHREQGEQVSTPHGDVYVFSNSNFTDVHRELHAFSLGREAGVELTGFMGTAVGGTVQPPGLRFPFSVLVGRFLVVGGTYLSQSAQQFALWALDLVAWTWTKIDAEVLEGNGARVAQSVGELMDGHGVSEDALAGGSWNRAVWWPAGSKSGGKLMVFGNRYRNLQDDYEHRAINLDHVAVVELEVFGIYQPPTRHPALQTRSLSAIDTTAPTPEAVNERARIEYALGALRDGRLQDLQVVCEDGRTIGCSSRLLEARWDWFKEQRRATGRAADTLAANTLHISESYPIVMAFLEYMYTLDLVTVLQHRIPVLTGLLLLAKQYRIPHLDLLVVHALHGRLDESTALGIYEVATLCECRNLQVRALKMVLAIQKRAGKGPHHRRQQSGAAVVSAQGGAGQATPSEGDSSRTVHALDSSTMRNGSQGRGQGEGEGYQTRTQQSEGAEDVVGHPVEQSLAFTAPPSAFSQSPRKRRCATPTIVRRGGADESPIVPEAALRGEYGHQDVVDGLGSEESPEIGEYDPPTYRTRRRSASVASVHHFTDDEATVGEQGQLSRAGRMSRHRVTINVRPVADDRRRSMHIARKIASMSSFFQFGAPRPVLGPIDTGAAARRTPISRGAGGRDVGYSSESSSPPSPVTPTDLPTSGDEPDTGAPSPLKQGVRFPYVGDEPPHKLGATLSAFTVRKGHGRTKSLGFHGMW